MRKTKKRVRFAKKLTKTHYIRKSYYKRGGGTRRKRTKRKRRKKSRRRGQRGGTALARHWGKKRKGIWAVKKIQARARGKAARAAAEERYWNTLCALARGDEEEATITSQSHTCASQREETDAAFQAVEAVEAAWKAAAAGGEAERRQNEEEKKRTAAAAAAFVGRLQQLGLIPASSTTAGATAESQWGTARIHTGLEAPSPPWCPTTSLGGR